MVYKIKDVFYLAGVGVNMFSITWVEATIPIKRIIE
jgi:hypothetical protein